MTYKELLKKLELLNEEQLSQTITIHDPYEDEYIAAIDAYTTNDTQVLDDNHFVIILKA